MMQPNTKIQRTGAEIFLLQLNLLPAADLERWADSKPESKDGIYLFAVSISTPTVRKELMRIRICRPPSDTPPSKAAAAQWLAGATDQRSRNLYGM